MKPVQSLLVVRLILSVLIPVIIWAAFIAVDATIPLMDPWHLVVDLAVFLGAATTGFLVVPMAWRRGAPLLALVYFPTMCVLLYFVGAEVSVRFLGKGP
jgi:hypothetical protein